MMLIDRQDGKGLRLESVPLYTIADRFGTPTYVYSGATFEQNWRAFDSALYGRAHSVCYAVKACSNIALLQLLAKLGSGFDIVSGGELERVRRVGGDLNKVVFSGVGKLPHEIENALRSNIRCLNVESSAELKAVEQTAERLGGVAPVALRINPDVAIDTHRYIATGFGESKFGVSPGQARDMYRRIAGSNVLQAVGIGCHIGSQITTTEPFAQAAKLLIELADELVADGLPLQHIDFGGGFAAGDGTLSAHEYMQVLTDAIGDRPWEVLIEPGRSISGTAGLLLTQVIYLKKNGRKKFAVVDAAMNDLIRPALYQAKHSLVEVREHIGLAHDEWDIVGAVCESGDFIAHDCRLRIKEGDLLAVLTAGAYGFSMAGNYNSRPRAAEVLVDGEQFHLIRTRETVTDLMANEFLLDE